MPKMAELQLLRPLNCFFTAASVLIGAVAGGAVPFPPPVWLAVLAAALVTGAGNAWNDLRDLEIDRINRPRRPLPAGRLTPRRAALVAAASAAAGLGLAIGAGPVPGLIAAGTLAGLWLYSVRLKSTVFWGNLLVAALAALAFPFGALAGGALGRAWIPAGFALLFHLGREIVKDVEDVEGDRARGVRTLALAVGATRARYAAASVYGLLIAGTVLPRYLGLYGWAYAAVVAVMDLLLLIVLARLLGGAGGTSRALTALMPLGLLAILAGELYPG